MDDEADLANNWPPNKAALLALIATDWQRLEDFIAGLTPEQLTTPNRTTGWAIKDHLAHLAAWEGGIVWLLRGRPRPAGMGLDDHTFYHTNMDEVNERIYQQNREHPHTEVMTHFRAIHQQMLEALADLQEEDLTRPYGTYDVNGPGRDDGRPIIRWIAADTYEHYQEHLSYFNQLF